MEKEREKKEKKWKV